MKIAIWLILLAITLSARAHQKHRPLRRQKSQFTGTYSSRFGEWRVLDLGHGKLKVSCELNFPYKVNGVWSANLGGCFGEAKLTGKTATLKPEETTACTITLTFSANKLLASQDGSDADCGFGHRVYANGTYRKRSSRPPRFDMEK